MFLGMGRRICFLYMLYSRGNRYSRHIQAYKWCTDHLASPVNMNKLHYCIQRSQHTVMDYMRHELDMSQ